MTQETIAIISVGVALIVAVVPLLIMLNSRIDRMNEQLMQITGQMAALANHRHAQARGLPDFNLPAD